MTDGTDPLVFPDCPTRLWLQSTSSSRRSTAASKDHYFDQLYRWYQILDQREHTHDTMALAAAPRSTVHGNERGDDAAVAIADDPSPIVKIRPSS
jgi:hypothetical protein